MSDNVIPILKKTSSPDSSGRKKRTTLNGKYEIVKLIQEGATSKVFLGRDIESRKKVAIKLIRYSFLMQDKNNIHLIENEIEILRGLKHSNIVKLKEFGCNGHFVNSSTGKEFKNQVYLVLEYANGGTLFDIIEKLGGVGEEAGRYLISQLFQSIQYLHKYDVAHRDLKLENILLDKNFGLKLTDFGFATYHNVQSLDSFRGTRTYIAPEILQGEVYDGK